MGVIFNNVFAKGAILNRFICYGCNIEQIYLLWVQNSIYLFAMGAKFIRFICYGCKIYFQHFLCFVQDIQIIKSIYLLFSALLVITFSQLIYVQIQFLKFGMCSLVYWVPSTRSSCKDHVHVETFCTCAINSNDFILLYFLPSQVVILYFLPSQVVCFSPHQIHNMK